MYDSSSKTLTELGQLVQSAWYAAYDADPAEFSAFQDAYAYNSYYVPTERWLKSELGIDMSGRADCVKGMVWGLSNMWGTGGVKKVLRGANLSNDMTDREFVTAVSAQMTDNIEKYSSQTQYYKGWKNRYKNELNDCLAFISLHEAEDEAAGGAAGSTDDAANGAAGDSAGDTGDSAGDAGAGSGSDSGSDEGAGDSAVSGSIAARLAARMTGHPAPALTALGLPVIRLVLARTLQTMLRAMELLLVAIPRAEGRQFLEQRVGEQRRFERGQLHERGRR